MLKRWRRLLRGARRGQALVEFALVFMLIISTMTGGVLVIQALFLQQRIIDIVARASEWGASTNSNEQIMAIVNEALTFSDHITYTLTPSDPAARKIGTKFTVSIGAEIPLLGAGTSLIAHLGASNTVLIENNPMKFAPPIAEKPTIRIGDLVVANTTAGENLKVHVDAGLKASTHFVLYKQDLATIIGGPVIKNGLRWWKIYDIRVKLTGWCVDNADGVETLVIKGHFF